MFPTIRALALFTLHLATAACGTRGDGGASASPAASSPAVSATALRIEQAERALDTGRDVDGARRVLAEIVHDPSVSPADSDRATLAASRAAELSGDRESAIALVEALLAARVDEHPWAFEAAADKRLRQLLTGSEQVARSVRERERRPVSRFAQQLTTFFPEGPARDVDVRMLRFGDSGEATKRLGTFEVGGAIRERRRAACPLCDDEVRVHTHESSGSWTAIPATSASSASALEVFYFDLADGRIPARYDARLPLPSADIVARLERGEGVIAVKRRPGSPPSILIAAPRWAQLAEVEDALSMLTDLPAQPIVVPVKPELRSEEIQAEVRSAFPRFRACYEALLAHAPDAAGSMTVSFAVESDGHVAEAILDEASTLRDPAMNSCMLDTFTNIRFPASKGRITVKYPVSFAPLRPR